MRNNPRDHHRSNGGIIMGVKSPAWFREWFGEYDTSKFEQNGACVHCGKHGGRYGAGALSGECYLGLCADCWTALLWHCLEVANRQIDRHPEKWGEERPDGLQLALYKIRRNVELGTFGLLCEVAINGEPNTELKEAQKAAVLKERKKERNRRYYIANKERLKAINAAWKAGHRDEYLGALKRWGERNRQRRREYNRQYWLDNKERITAKRRAKKNDGDRGKTI